jgi:hypothetical protein
MTGYAYPLPDLRSQILSFKVVDLQNCAGRLGISKSGKKAEVQNRLLCYFGLNPVTGPGDISADVQGKLESAARVIKDVYCQSRGITRNPSSSPGLGGPSSRAHTPAAGGAGTSAAYTPNDAANAHLLSTKIKLNASNTSSGGGIVRCLCKNNISRPNMVQCAEPSCGVWQHVQCVAHTNASTSNTATTTPTPFYCEECRVQLADPFWKPLELLLPVGKLKPTVGVPPIRDSYNELHPQQTAELTVYLSEQQLSKSKHLPDTERIIASCLLLEDAVPCRYHWPRNVTMKVNRYPYRVYGRSSTSKMGINQRDEVANIGTLCLAGRNTLDIQAVESGTWLILLHRVEARTVNQVKEMMLPMESVGEAVTRVKKLMHDDDFAIASQVVSLIDPWSGQRMTEPARFSNASGLQAFDLDSFLSLAQRNRKWQDPTTLKNSTIRQLQVDTYTKRVLSCLSSGSGGGGGGSSECLEVREIVINDEGKWRPEGTDEASLRWFSIEEEEGIVKKELREFYSGGGNGGGGGSAKKSNHAQGNNAQTTVNGGGGGGDSEGVFLSDTESDEEEELRKAAAAVKASAAEAAREGKKRKAESEPEPEVICLLSDSDDEYGGGANNRGANRPNTTAQIQQPAAAAARPPPKLAPVFFRATTANAAGGSGSGSGSGRGATAAAEWTFPRVPPMYQAIQRPPPPRPPPSAPQSLPTSPGGGGGNAGRVLSQSAQEALAETLAAIHGDAELMDQINQDDW